MKNKEEIEKEKLKKRADLKKRIITAIVGLIFMALPVSLYIIAESEMKKLGLESENSLEPIASVTLSIFFVIGLIVFISSLSIKSMTRKTKLKVISNKYDENEGKYIVKFKLAEDEAVGGTVIYKYKTNSDNFYEGNKYIIEEDKYEVELSYEIISQDMIEFNLKNHVDTDFTYYS